MLWHAGKKAGFLAMQLLVKACLKCAADESQQKPSACLRSIFVWELKMQLHATGSLGWHSPAS